MVPDAAGMAADAAAGAATDEGITVDRREEGAGAAGGRRMNAPAAESEAAD
jgi:hypothetical protein